MRSFIRISLCGALALVLSSISFQAMAANQGFSECLEKCYLKKCGEGGLGCPTEDSKRIYRNMCRGKCQQLMVDQAHKRRMEMYRLRMEAERKRYLRYRTMTILRHKQWVAKKQLVHRLKARLAQAKQAGQAQQMHRLERRVRKAVTSRMNLMQRKLNVKERFYGSRIKYQKEQLKRYRYRLKRLKKQLALAKAKKQSQNIKEAESALKQEQHRAKKAKSQMASVNVDFHKTRVQRHAHKLKSIKREKAYLEKDKAKAKKAKDQKKLEDLAKKLGELAGQQTAVQFKHKEAKAQLQKASHEKRGMVL